MIKWLIPKKKTLVEQFEKTQQKETKKLLQFIFWYCRLYKI